MPICDAVPPVQQIEWWDAWGCWFAGRQPPSDAVLWFMSLRWWARAGKIAAFLGGSTVILDLIGPERLRQWATTHVDNPRLWGVFYLALGVAVLGFGAYALFFLADDPNFYVSVSGYLFAFLFVLLLNLALIFTRRIALGLARVMRGDQPGQLFRYIGAVLLLVGFHFDLLSS